MKIEKLKKMLSDNCKTKKMFRDDCACCTTSEPAVQCGFPMHKYCYKPSNRVSFLKSIILSLK